MGNGTTPQPSSRSLAQRLWRRRASHQMLAGPNTEGQRSSVESLGGFVWRGSYESV